MGKKTDAEKKQEYKPKDEELAFFPQIFKKAACFELFLRLCSESDALIIKALEKRIEELTESSTPSAVCTPPCKGEDQKHGEENAESESEKTEEVQKCKPETENRAVEAVQECKPEDKKTEEIQEGKPENPAGTGQVTKTEDREAEKKQKGESESQGKPPSHSRITKNLPERLKKRLVGEMCLLFSRDFPVIQARINEIDRHLSEIVTHLILLLENLSALPAGIRQGILETITDGDRELKQALLSIHEDTSRSYYRWIRAACGITKKRLKEMERILEKRSV